MNNIKNTKGITLISLVVTIIILLILAGVTILILMGDNGLINRTKEAKTQTEIASIKEEIQTDILGKQAENEGKISNDALEKILEKYGILSEEGEKITDKTLTTTKGNYKIKVLDLFNGTTVENEPKEPIFATVANKPDIDGFDKTKTYYVAWNENAEKTKYVLDEKKMSETTAPSDWYDYAQGINKWANVKTIGGGNECYWVWIPRYAYKVPTKGSTAETIEVKFLQGKSNKPVDGTSINLFQATEDKEAPSQGDWVVHPAFTETGNGRAIKNEDGSANQNYVGNGGFGELTGIWVAKYEASSNSVSENTVISDLATTGGGNVTNLQVRVKPNVTSWREITPNNIFTVCRNLTEVGNSLENTSNLNSHMMKNIEWGAVAYLSRSVYGKNDKIWKNPYYDEENYSPITGLCGKGTSDEDLITTDITNTCKYNEINAGNASTTGNVYGVYDMVGGAEEFVAGYLENSSDNERYTTIINADARYKDVYLNYPSNVPIYKFFDVNRHKYGDAYYETSSCDEKGNYSWEDSHTAALYGSMGLILRGGRSRDNLNLYGVHSPTLAS